jgi:hypothetical protein
MKGSRLKDVLDDKVFNKDFWDKMFKKMRLLLIKIENTNPSIDDADLRWVSDRLEYYESEERILSSDEMRVANNLWNKYGKKA